MTDVAGLVAWLRAQLDEDERKARAAYVKQQGDPEWWVSEVMGAGGACFTVRSRRDNRPIARVQRLEGYDGGEPGDILEGRAAAAHIAEHDPARVLREIACKRKLLALHAGRHACSDAVPGNETQAMQLFVYWTCPTVRILAEAYSDRLGWQEEWRPSA